MTKVVVRNGNIDGALKKFKQKVAKSGLPSEMKKREAYSKPGIQRREAKKDGIKTLEKETEIEINLSLLFDKIYYLF